MFSQPPNPSHPAVGHKTPQFLAALMGRSGLGKHRSSPLRCGRVVQSSSKGGDWSQVGWLSVIAMETTFTCVVTSTTPITNDSTSLSVCVRHRMRSFWVHVSSGSLLSVLLHPLTPSDWFYWFPLRSHMKTLCPDVTHESNVPTLHLMVFSFVSSTFSCSISSFCFLLLSTCSPSCLPPSLPPSFLFLSPPCRHQRPGS